MKTFNFSGIDFYNWLRIKWPSLPEACEHIVGGMEGRVTEIVIKTEENYIHITRKTT